MWYYSLIRFPINFFIFLSDNFVIGIDEKLAAPMCL